MPNELSFETYFKREDIQALLDLDITQICITGTLKLSQDDSCSMTVTAAGFGGSFADTPTKPGCPRPCP